MHKEQNHSSAENYSKTESLACVLKKGVKVQTEGVQVERRTLGKFKWFETDCRTAVLNDKQDYTYTLNCFPFE